TANMKGRPVHLLNDSIQEKNKREEKDVFREPPATYALKLHRLSASLPSSSLTRRSRTAVRRQGASGMRRSGKHQTACSNISSFCGSQYNRLPLQYDWAAMMHTIECEKP